MSLVILDQLRRILTKALIAITFLSELALLYLPGEFPLALLLKWKYSREVVDKFTQKFTWDEPLCLEGDTSVDLDCRFLFVVNSGSFLNLEKG